MKIENTSLKTQRSGGIERDNLRYNFTVNLLDGGFFGAALGFSSFITIIPLFVSGLTQSAVLIGLIPAIHSVGWQLPQLFTANRVSRLQIYKPSVLKLTIHERLPFLGLALIAWFTPTMGVMWALILTFVMLVWQGLGGGFTANAWQSMIAKIIPTQRLGTFFGLQSASANLLASGAAVAAGELLERQDSPLDFTFCFLIAFIAMAISWGFLALTREAQSPPRSNLLNRQAFLKNLGFILKTNINFRWFLITRMLTQFATMGFAFYTVYAFREQGMSEGTIGIMTGVLLATQIVANPLMGWVGDRRGHHIILLIGIFAATASSLTAWLAKDVLWFYLVFILAGIANVAAWTTSMTITLEFGGEGERPAYIGLANTLIAPFTILAPILGGWLADYAGYNATFFASAVVGLLTMIIVQTFVHDPRRKAYEYEKS